MPSIQERPRAERHRALKSAQIRFYNANGVIDCTIRNVSDTGAKLSVATPIGIPEFFELRQTSQPTRHCRIIRRNANEIGVQFIMEPMRV
jgi:PilZ domain